MKIAVTGASGFLGRPLVKRLTGAGHQVVALGRSPDKLQLPPGATARKFDAAQPVPPETLAGCDAVVNLAGELIGQRWTEEIKQRIRDSRVIGTRALAEAACAAKTVRTFVSASAVGYYGPHGDEPLTETDPSGTDFLSGVCRDWEAATTPAKACGIRVPILRIGLVLHPEGAAFQKMVPLFKAGLGGRLGSGEQVMSWVHRDDVLALIEHALFKATTLDGPLNAVAPGAVTNAEFTHAMGKALHRPTFLPAPSFALRIAFGQMSEAVLTGQRVVPKRALESGFQFQYPELGATLASFFR